MQDERVYPDDLLPVANELQAKNIPFEIRRHPVAESLVKDILGSYPTGEYQIIIEKNGNRYSIIRGYISFGAYEIMQTKGEGQWSDDPERFDSAKKLVKAVGEELRMNPINNKREGE